MILTKYEVCEIVGGRAMMLSAGASTLLIPDQMPAGCSDTIRIASRELQLGLLDAKIVRGGVEYDLRQMRVPENAFHATRNFRPPV